MGLFGANDFGMDLGTVNLLIVERGRGIVLSEPSYVVCDRETRVVKCAGTEAFQMYGKVPESDIVECPLRKAHIHSFDLTGKMLAYFMNTAIGKRRGIRPRLYLAEPGGLAPSERHALLDALIDAGARSVIEVDECVASAIGAGLRIDQPYGRMIVDIGAARTNIAVFSLGHQVMWHVEDFGGDQFDWAVTEFLRRKHNLQIGGRTAEEIKIDLGTAKLRDVARSREVFGRAMLAGLPRSVKITSDDVNEALDMPIRDLINRIHRFIEQMPPELASDIFDEGFTITGGGAKLYGIDDLLSEQLRIKVSLAEEPELCVAHGLLELMSEPELYDKIELKSKIGAQTAEE